MNEKPIYGLLLLLCGWGWWLWQRGKIPAQENRGTFFGTLEMMARRMATSLPEKNRIFLRMKEKLEAGRLRRIDEEIFDSSMLLKNLAIVERNHAFSADYLYECLLENSKKLRPVYGEMLSVYRSGRDEQAFRILTEQAGTKAARNFAMVLEKVDRINPQELVEQMEVFQEMMQQQRLTADMKQIQRDSLITTVMATAVVFVMLIDFAVVVVFLHTMDMIYAAF